MDCSCIISVICLVLSVTIQLPGTEGIQWKEHQRFPHAEGHTGEPIKPLDVSLPTLYKHRDAEKYFATKDPKFSLRSEGTGGPETVDAGTADVCLSPSCVKSAATYLDNMDEEQDDPCEDFYYFACKSRVRKALIPEYQQAWSYFTDVDEQIHGELRMLLSKPIDLFSPSDINIKLFYRSCLNEDQKEKLDLEPLMNFMDALEITIPLLNRYRTKNMDSPSHTVESIMVNIFGDTGLFGIGLTSDLKHAQGPYLMMVYQPTLFLDSQVYLDRSETSEKTLSIYKEYVEEVITRLHLYMTKTRGQYTEKEKIKIAVDEMVGLETALARNMRDRTEQVEFIKFSEFKKILNHRAGDKINIARIFINSMKRLANYTVHDDTMIQVPDVNYFSKAARIINQTPNDVLINYLVIKEVLNLLPATTPTMRALSRRFQELTSGVATPPPRWITCISTISSNFGTKISQMYNNEHKDSNAHSATLKMTQNLAHELKSMIRKAKWMDQETKEEAFDKLDEMDIIAGYSERLSRKNVERVFETLEPMSEDDYLLNTLKLKKFWLKKTINLIHENHTHFADINDKGYDTTMVNAMYSPIQNSIYIPFGIQKPPFYIEKGLLSQMYGSLGAIVGHEMSHGFDNTGSNFDKDGNLRDWWSEGSKKKYEERLQCFIDQYSNFTYDFSGVSPMLGQVHVNGKLTLGENVADNTGIRQAWNAYKRHLKEENIVEPSLPGLSNFSNDQIFFLGYANMWCETKTLLSLLIQLKTNVHPPHAKRVNGVLSNTKEFQEAFKCPAGSKMVPEKRCSIF